MFTSFAILFILLAHGASSSQQPKTEEACPATSAHHDGGSLNATGRVHALVDEAVRYLFMAENTNFGTEEKRICSISTSLTSTLVSCFNLSLKLLLSKHLYNLQLAHAFNFAASRFIELLPRDQMHGDEGALPLEAFTQAVALVRAGLFGPILTLMPHVLLNKAPGFKPTASAFERCSNLFCAPIHVIACGVLILFR